MKSGNFNFLEPSGSLQACNGNALPLFHVLLLHKLTLKNLILSSYFRCERQNCVQIHMTSYSYKITYPSPSTWASDRRQHNKQNICRTLAAPFPIFLLSGRCDRDTPFNIANVRTSETCDSNPSSAISVLRIKFYVPHTHTRARARQKVVSQTPRPWNVLGSIINIINSYNEA